MKRIAIIGAGLSGTLLAINLLKQAVSKIPASIFLIDRNPSNEMGPAYSSSEDCLLLNVPACKMGAHDSDPEGFLKWARKKGIKAGEFDFLPRKLYKEYIHELLEEAIQSKSNSTLFNRLQGEVSDIDVAEGIARLHIGDSRIEADIVVLALGNFPPRNLPLKNKSFLTCPNYYQNPWPDEAYKQIKPGQTVFIIGTGQTTIDILNRLFEKKHKGKIIAISTHGHLPNVHSDFQTYPSFFEEIKDLNSIAMILRIFRRHIRRANEIGMDVNSVMDSLRPHTQQLWLHLSFNERSRFLRHLFRYFEIVRSRIPPQSNHLVDKMLKSEQLRIIRGRIQEIIVSTENTKIIFIPYKSNRAETIDSDIVINCIGPEMNYEKIDQPFLQSLLKKGIIQTDPLNLGMNATIEGEIINNQKSMHKIFYTLGSTMRGILWEVLAVPEIRIQAELLSTKFLSDTSDENL